MKSLLFFSGRHSLSGIGATSVIVSNLFPSAYYEIEGSIIGMGYYRNPEQVSSSFTQVDLFPQYSQRILPYRVLSKVTQIMLPVYYASRMQHMLNNKMNIIADNLAATHLNTLLSNKPEVKIVIGLSSMSLAGGRTAKAAGKRYAIHCQWHHPHQQYAWVAGGYRALGLSPPPYSRSCVRRQLAEFELADIIWCPSKSVQQSLVDNGVPKNKTFVSYLGVDTKRFYVPEDVRQQSNKSFQILFVGTVCVQKGIHVLLEALLMADIPAAELILNGQTDTVAQRLLKKYLPKLTKKNISIQVDPGDPCRYHKSASVFVLPSVHDAYGIVVPEAMAAGLPIIVSDHVGAKEIVEHGRNGFIFPSMDSKKLAEYLEFFYKNPEKRKAFGRTSEKMSLTYNHQQRSRCLIGSLATNLSRDRF